MIIIGVMRRKLKQSYNFKNTEKYLILFCIGSLVYPLLEIIWRGYTHPTMAIVGGVCFCLIYYADEKMHRKAGILLRAVIGGLIITATEFVSGCIINLILGLSVWDYSRMPFNLLGQICLPFTALWMILCIPVIYLCGILRKYFVRFLYIPYDNSDGKKSTAKDNTNL